MSKNEIYAKFLLILVGFSALTPWLNFNFFVLTTKIGLKSSPGVLSLHS